MSNPFRDIWNNGEPANVIALAKIPDVLKRDDIERFGVWAAMQVCHLMKTKECKQAIQARNNLINGVYTHNFDHIIYDAKRVSWDCGVADKCATWYGFDAANAAVVANGNHAAMMVEDEIHKLNAYHIASNEALADQCEWLRGNVTPIFSK